MNERIKELAREAGLLAYNPEGPPTKLKKFALLIVRECADIAKIHVMNISTYADAEFVEEQILKDLGVEE